MERYKNLGGDSNVTGYEIHESSIEVQFGDGSIYLYTDQSAGAANIQKMKALAVQGRGLNSFIGLHVRKSYSKKLR